MTRLFALALVVAAVVAAAYFLKRGGPVHTPRIGPGINIVTINPLPS